jgi:hypothetical protein
LSEHSTAAAAATTTTTTTTLHRQHILTWMSPTLQLVDMRLAVLTVSPNSL